MDISHDEALAILRKLKVSQVYLRLRQTAEDDPTLGALRVSAEAMLEECDDENGLLLTWRDNGQLRLMLNDASFRVADYDESAVGLEIHLREGVRCVVCPSRPVNRVVNQFLNR